MTVDDMKTIVALVSYPDYVFEVLVENDIAFLRGSYLDPDIVTHERARHYTRKWRLSEYMVRSELVQTVFKCVLTSAEHRTREHFLYRGERVFGPHFDVDALYEIAKARRLDYRGRSA